MKKTIIATILPVLMFSTMANAKGIIKYLDSQNKLGNPTPNIIKHVLWEMDSPGMPVTGSTLDAFGKVVTHGDFNDDGFQDLAIGIPRYDFFTAVDAGTVLVMYGAANGLSTNNSQLLFQTFTTMPSNIENDNGVEENDEFGTSLTSGDFNCDGIDDLAVGTPKEDVILAGDDGVPRTDVGAVNIFYGTNNGFSDNGQGSTFLLQGTGTNSMSQIVEQSDLFGTSLVAGNFNNDFVGGIACMDLAIGTSGEDLSPDPIIFNEGQVDVLYGGIDPIDGVERDSINQDTPGVQGVSGKKNVFGFSLAVGKFKKSLNIDFLVVGIPGETINGEPKAGAIQVFESSNGGLLANVQDFIISQSGSILGNPESGDRFGSSLTIGDFNGDGADDIAIGVPDEDISSPAASKAGAVNVIYGSVTGLISDNNQLFFEGDSGLQGQPSDNEFFGEAIVSGELNYDSYSDLVIGVPFEGSKGAFHVIYGTSSGLTTNNNDYFGSNDQSDRLAATLTVADFGNGSELVAGAPLYDSDISIDTGAVRVFEFINPDVIFKNSFED